jgi:hypothetical protein
MLRLLLTLGIGLPVLGGLFAWYGFKERDIAQASSATPDTLTLSQLIARGPDGNANVVVTDYVALRPHVMHRGKRGRWSGAWVAVVPKDDAPAGGGPPKAVRAFVFSGARDPDAVYQRLSNPQLPRMVSNRIMTPNDSEKDELQGLFPQADFSTCVYFHEGREPASEERSALMIYGGIAAGVIGLGLLGLALVLWRKGAAEEARRKGRRTTGPLRGDEDDDDEPRPRKRRVADDEDDEQSRQKRRPAEDEDGPTRRRRPVAGDDDDDDDRPRRRQSVDDEDDRRRRRRDRDD